MFAFCIVILFQNHREGQCPAPTEDVLIFIYRVMYSGVLES